MSDLVIRPLEGDAEYRACVALQRTVWGERFTDVVPGSIQMVAQELGGVASGAFLEDRLVGFVFGLTGLRNGSVVHWSDMLAVDPAYRGAGIGRRLKLHQRDLLLDRDVRHMLWTFDPLVARNGHLNLTVLGATARTYRRDLYGETDSPLHVGLGTDRLLAEWELNAERVRERLEGHVEQPASARFINPPDRSGPLPRPGPAKETLEDKRLAVAIPADIMALRKSDPALTREWRDSVRSAFERAFAAGYVAVEAARLDSDIAAYTLARGF